MFWKEMRLPERNNLIEVLAIPLIAVGLSSISLWLLESSLKYPLFILGAALILFLCLAYLNPSLWQFSVRVRGVTIILDYLLFAASLTLLLLVVSNSYGIVNQAMAVIVCFFLPGYTLLRFIRFRPLHTWVEKLVLSMVLSIPISCLIYTFVLILIPNQERALALVLVYLFIALLLILRIILRSMRPRSSESAEELHAVPIDVMDAVLLVTILSFAIYVLSVTYPQMAYLPGYDIVGHFSAAGQLNAVPDLYSTTKPWFHFQWAQILLLAKQPIGIFQSSMAYLSLIMVLSFYIMAKAYLRDVDRRLPILATVFFSLFSGFGWVYFLKEKLTDGNLSTQLALLAKLNDISYWDINYGQGPMLWLWQRPWTLGITLFLVLLYLLKRQDLSRRDYILLFSLSAVALGMLHLPELIAFVALLFALALFKPKIELGLKRGLLATTIGVCAMAALIAFYGQFLGLSIRVPYTYLAALGAVLLISYVLTRFGRRPSLGAGTRVMPVLVLLAALVYVALLMSWLSAKEPFSALQLMEVYSVPWMLYPVRLGIGGLLGLAGLMVVVKQYRDHPVVTFGYLFIVTLFMAKSVDFLNVRFMQTGYFEERMTFPIYLALSVLAALALVKAGKILSGQTLRQLFAALMVGIIIVFGLTSTLLGVEYRQYVTGGALGEEHKDAIARLSIALEENPRAPIWTVSNRSRMEAEFAPSYSIPLLGEQLWSSVYPEMTLNILPFEEGLSPPYLYLHERDLDILHNEYPDSYIARHLLPYFPNLYRGSETEVYQTPELTTPRSQSDVALLIPLATSEDYLFTYDMLSLGGWDYTTYLEMDPNPEGEIFIVPYDRPFNMEKLSGKQIVIVNSNGYGPYAERVFERKSTLSLSFDESPEDAFFHVAPDYPTQLTSLNAVCPFNNEFEFIVDNDATEYQPTILSDDNQTSFWTPSAYGEGDIGVPILADDSRNKAEGSNSLSIQVGEGNNLVWVLSHSFEEPQDWSSYDFLSFYWYGYGDNKRYDLDIRDSEGGRFYYTFFDSWEGWKKVLIPLRMETGTHQIAGVTITKSLIDEPSWDKIKLLRITLAGGNFNRTGTWFLDRVTLDTGRWVKTSLEMHNLPAERSPLTVSIYDGASYLDIPLAGEGKVGTIPNTQLYFLDGSNAVELYGEGSAGTTKIEESQESYSLALSLKLPPDLGDDSVSGGISQVTVRVGLPTGESRAVGITSDRGELNLSDSLTIPQLEPRDGFETVADYVCEAGERVPLAVRGIIDGSEVTYLNAYPLVEQWAAESEFGARAYSPARDLLGHIGLSLPQGTYGDITSYLSKLMFKEAVLNGNVEIVSPSIVFSPLPSDTRIQVRSEGTTIYYAGVVSAEIEGAEKVTVSTTSATLGQGKGFYARLSSGESAISADGENIVLSLELADGKSVRLSMGSYLEFRVVGEHEVYLRTPQVSVEGEVRFSSAYAYRELEIYPRPLGQDLLIDGYAEFSLPLSDTYSMAQDFTWSGSKERDPPIYQRPGEQDFKNALPYGLLLLLVTIFSYVIYQSGRKEEKDSNSPD